jgi:uncharacterized protein (TIGR01244 family)
MSEFRALTDNVLASPQIDLADIGDAAAQGVKLVINNRPEGEAPDQTPGSELEAAARAAGMDYVAIPIVPGQFGEVEVAAMGEALERAGGKVLAFCRTGTRSTLLWSLVQASKGQSPDEVAAIAAQAGYDVSPVRDIMDMLAESAAD